MLIFEISKFYGHEDTFAKCTLIRISITNQKLHNQSNEKIEKVDFGKMKMNSCVYLVFY